MKTTSILRLISLLKRQQLYKALIKLDNKYILNLRAYIHAQIYVPFICLFLIVKDQKPWNQLN